MDIIKEIREIDRISINVIFTHFAAADEVDKSFTEMQGEKFKYMLNRLKEEGIEVPLVHAANSAAIVDCDDLKFDMVRAGIIMYGCYPSDDIMKERVPVEPVMTIKTANSAAIVDCDDLKFDMVRAGIIMYGCYPSDDIMKERVPVEPVMTIKTRVSHIKTIEPGEKISYGCTYEAKEKERIATLAIGYADGFVRGRKNPKVCINGKL